MTATTGDSRAARRAVWVGLAGLAAAMGIGRFAFTPLLPLMQEHSGLTLSGGGWLAASNYVGYLAGALASFAWDPAPHRAARWGLVAVVLSTLAMGLLDHFGGWLLWRFIAGLGSAMVLVGTSSWALAVLARAARSHWAGWMFAGVGVGIVIGGLTGLVAGVRHWSADAAWLALGALAALVTLACWPAFAPAGGAAPTAGPASPAPPPPVGSRAYSRDARLLVLSYAAFGFGYSIPATFLPAMARQLIADPAVFGWVWPAFGAAGAASTIVASLALRRVAPRLVWGVSHWIMAIGVAVPLVGGGAGTAIPALLVSAVCIGGTFMLLTLAALQEARRVVAPAAAPRFIAAMTAAFAFGQIVGPALVSLLPAGPRALVWPSAAAALLLAATGGWLLRSAARR